MPISRTNEYEYVPPDNSFIGENYAKKLNAYYNGNQASVNKMSVQEYVNTLIDKAGMSEYIKMVNSQLETNQTKEAADISNILQEFVSKSPILQNQEIKSKIDSAINNHRFTNPISLVSELQGWVDKDKTVSDDIKNVLGDENLRKYVATRMGKTGDEKIDYELGQKPSDIKSSEVDNKASTFMDKPSAQQ